jgi:glycosyltransferase involved in cell wall biosynthesis
MSDRPGIGGGLNSPSVAAVVLARDEEANLRDCLQSVAWADRLCVLLDPRTTDRTAEIATELGALVREHQFADFASQRNAALDAFEADWVFFIDADERCTSELAAEIRSAIQHPANVGWWVPRRNYIWGRWIRHAGWYPDHQLRLIKRGWARYDPTREVHEVVVLDGSEGYLEHPFVHYNYATVGQFLQKQDHYAYYEARVLVQEGICPRPHSLLLQPVREFTRRYLTLQGYRDGLHGLLLCMLMAHYTFVAYWRARRICALEARHR